MQKSPTLYTLPAGLPFADILAQGILQECDFDPQTLTRYRILLPTRRACRALREAFLRQSDGKPLLLPIMHPIGDIDEDELILKMADASIDDIPPAISPLKRQILMGKMIEARPDFHGDADQAIKLAGELGKLLDQVIIADLSLDNLENIHVGDYADHWQKTVKFLDLIRIYWPQILEERGVIEAADRRNRLIHALNTMWQENPPQTPIIAAGSTGTVPATGELLHTIAHLPLGCVLLPGLDHEIDPESWDALDATHPQATLKTLLQRFDAKPADIKIWPAIPEDAPKTRQKLLREIMRPAETTKEWAKITKADIAPDIETLHRFDCENEQEEALLIALLMRETLETASKTAALVTPDRALAKRVSMACRRWGIELDDSGGKTLNQSYRGGYFKLLLTASLHHLQAPSLVPVLKHGLSTLGYCRQDFSNLCGDIEKYAFRDNIAYKYLTSLLGKVNKPDKTPKLHSAHAELLEKIESAFAPLIALTEGEHAFYTLYKAHLTLAETLCATPDKNGAEILWREEDGEEAAKLFAELGELASDMPPMTLTGYASILDSLMETRPVRPAYGTHPRLMILGHLEARLIQADRMILSALNEESWPPKAEHDPWMSRPMRGDFGLPSPEMRVGLSAHDFGQAFCAKEVILTRAKKNEGAPTVPCRWLERLDAVLKAADIEPLTLSQLDYHSLLQSLSAITGEPTPYERPRPVPPVSLRPKELYATHIETWMTDPYALYAKKILNLKKLEDLDTGIDARLKGDALHKAFERFIDDHRKGLPHDAHGVLREYLMEELGELAEDKAFMNFWQPRLTRLIDWFIDQETKWREDAIPGILEREGTYTLADKDFTLKAFADRIDTVKDGTAAIIDYKTGSVPSNTKIQAGYAPQLPLEALILLKGAFPDFTQKQVSSLAYWKASGGADDKVTSIKPDKEETLHDLIARYEQNLHVMIEIFAKPETPYISLPKPSVAPRYQDYAHLARVQEWAALDDAEDGEEAA